MVYENNYVTEDYNKLSNNIKISKNKRLSIIIKWSLWQIIPLTFLNTIQVKNKIRVKIVIDLLFFCLLPYSPKPLPSVLTQETCDICESHDNPCQTKKTQRRVEHRDKLTDQISQSTTLNTYEIFEKRLKDLNAQHTHLIERGKVRELMCINKTEWNKKKSDTRIQKTVL